MGAEPPRSERALRGANCRRYSNTGMVLLGAVIAQASGEDYYAYIRDHVLTPAGMTATGSFASDDPVENLATGYIHAPGARENTTHLLLRGVPAGEGYSNLADLRRFALALQTGKLVSPAAVERLWADHDHANYAAGFEIEHGAIGLSAGHSGCQTARKSDPRSACKTDPSGAEVCSRPAA